MDPEALPCPLTAAILLGIDGQPHTDRATSWALWLAASAALPVTALHVKDPYLKQFYNEIYAQGRQEYLDHVEACLCQQADEAVAAFAEVAEAAGVQWSSKVAAGDPLAELRAEALRGGYGVVVLGGRSPSGLERWRYGDLPRRLAAAGGDVPVVIVRS